MPWRPRNLRFARWRPGAQKAELSEPLAAEYVDCTAAFACRNRFVRPRELQGHIALLCEFGVEKFDVRAAKTLTKRPERVPDT